MKIYNTQSKANFVKSIVDISNKLGIEIDYQEISHDCYRVVLKKNKSSSKYQRIGFLEYKSICWHGYKDFLIELYNIYDDLRIYTAQITYSGDKGCKCDRFDKIYENYPNDELWKARFREIEQRAAKKQLQKKER